MDSNSLRAILGKTDPMPQSVQASSRAIMRYYDHSPTNAVNEWRNSIQTCSASQLLPLLYVANEVLQTSKRNRGNKFLEAFSPVLGTTTRYICERDRSIVEKVRRVIKIWGDRRVFSQRYVAELLTGLDSLRNQAAPPPTAKPSSLSNKPKSILKAVKRVDQSAPARSQSPTPSIDSVGSDSSPFSNQGPSLLQVDVNIEQEKVASSINAKKISRKRPRDQIEKNAASNPAKKLASPVPTPKRKVYSTSTLLDLVRKTEVLSSEYHSAKSMVEGCPSSHFSTDPDSISDLVGDDLVKMHDDVRNTSKLLFQQRKKMHAIAKERRELELDAVKFIPSLKDSLKQDDNELEFCDRLEEKIKLLAIIIESARSARENRRNEEEEKRNKADAEQRQKEEEAERKKLLESAIQGKVDLPGMVYNPATRDYQQIHDHTEDDWRN